MLSRTEWFWQSGERGKGMGKTCRQFIIACFPISFVRYTISVHVTQFLCLFNVIGVAVGV